MYELLAIFMGDVFILDTALTFADCQYGALVFTESPLFAPGVHITCAPIKG
jgi:hypothetical protein